MKYFYSILALLIAFNLSYAEDNPNDYQWLSGFGFNNFVGAEIRVVEIDNNLVYTVLGNILFRYDLSTREWNAIAAVSSGSINDIAVHNHNVYFCGSFKEVNGEEIWGVAGYNPIDETLSQVGSKVTGQINCIGFINSSLFIGGENIDDGEQTSPLWYSDYGKWPWSKFPQELEGTIYAISHDDGNYIGGSFQGINDLQIKNLAMIETGDKRIVPIEHNIEGTIFSINYDSELIIGGTISEIDGEPFNNIARYRYNNKTWDDMSGGVDGAVYDIAFSDGDYLVGGLFDSRTGKNKYNIAGYIGYNEPWQELNLLTGGDYPTVFDIEFLDDDWNILVCGSFTKADGKNVNGITIIEEFENYHDLFENNKSGASSLIYDFTVGEDEKLYIGGAFNNVGEETSPGIAAWDGFEWESLKGGLFAPAVVYAVESYKDDIYFSGWFPGADGVELNNIAKWNIDDKEYVGIGDGIDGEDGDLGPIIIIEDTLYTGGRFVFPGKEDSHGIAKWNNFEWEGMKSGVKSAGQYTARVNTFAKDSAGMLYVGGSFDTVGIEYAQGIAVWNPHINRWFGFMNAIEGTVHAIHFTEDYVYIGGNIKKVYSEEANNIIRLDWHNLIWTSLGDGTNGPVYTITEYDNSLYIGGSFSRAGNSDANSIAVYSLALDEFFPLGSGIIDTYRPGFVSTLQVYKDKLYVGGLFNTAGGKYSNNIAVWDGLLTSVEETPNDLKFDVSVVPNPVRNSTKITITIPKSGKLTAGLYDFQGNEIMQLTSSENYPVGSREFELNTENLSSSVYFCKIYFDGNIITKKILVIR